MSKRQAKQEESKAQTATIEEPKAETAKTEETVAAPQEVVELNSDTGKPESNPEIEELREQLARANEKLQDREATIAEIKAYIDSRREKATVTLDEGTVLHLAGVPVELLMPAPVFSVSLENESFFVELLAESETNWKLNSPHLSRPYHRNGKPVKQKETEEAASE